MVADFDPGTGLGPRLRQARAGRQLSVRELARRMGCSASLISQIERGVSVPSVGVVYALATELGSSLDYLLVGSGAWPAETRAGGDEAGAGADETRAGADEAGAAGPAGPGRAAAPPPIVQRGCDRRIIDLASGVRWERLTPTPEAMTDFLEVIYS